MPVSKNTKQHSVERFPVNPGLVFPVHRYMHGLPSAGSLFTGGTYIKYFQNDGTSVYVMDSNKG